MQQENRHLYEFGPFRLDPVDRLLWRDREVVPLAPKGVEMLLLFVESGGRVLSKEDLMARLWPDAFVEEANLSHQVYKLREALGDGTNGSRYIETIARRGYRFAGEMTRRVESTLPPVSDGAPTGPAEPVGPALSVVESSRADRWRRRYLPWAITVVLGVVVLVQWVLSRPATPIDPVQLTIELSATASIVPSIGPAAVLSPDGRTVAFRGRLRPDGTPQIFVRRLNQAEGVPLAGTENVTELFFSPDGQWIGFEAGRRLRKVRTGGGDVITLSEVGLFRGGDWTRDGVIVFAPGPRMGLFTVPDGGGAPEPLTSLNASAGEVTHRFPQVLPDGRTVIFTANSTSVSYDNALIMAQPLGGGTPKLVLRGGYAARYVGSGHLLYTHKAVLFAVPFDPDRVEVIGTPVPVVEHIAGFVGSAGAQFSVSNDGTLIYLRGTGPDISAALVWVDANGRREPLRMPAPYQAPRFSPDGRRVALQISSEGRSKIWVYDIARDVMSRLTADSGADEVEPLWTPDGQRIVFSSDREAIGRPHLFSKRVDGSDAPTRLTADTRTEHEQPGAVLSDGTTLLYGALSAPRFDFSILKTTVEGSLPGKAAAPPQAVLDGPYDERRPAVSPDGRWIAYESSETGRRELFVRRYPELDGKEQISANGGGAPTWSAATNELFFSSADNQQVMAVTYSPAGGAFRAGKPRVWAQARLADLNGNRNFDVHPDGRRIVIVEAPEGQAGLAENTAVIYFNLFDELRRLAPPRRRSR